MRNLKTVAVLGLVLAVTGSAMAVSTIPPWPLGDDPDFGGWIRGKYISWSSGRSYSLPVDPDTGIPTDPDTGLPYDLTPPSPGAVKVIDTFIGEGVVNALPQTNPAVLWDPMREDSVTIFQLTEIREDGGANPALWLDGSDSEREVWGVFYGLRDQAIQFTLDGQGNITQTISSAHGRMKLWIQESGCMDPCGTTRQAFDDFSGIGPDDCDAALLAEMITTSWDGSNPLGAPAGHQLASFTATDLPVTGAGFGDADLFFNGIGGIWHDGDMDNGEMGPGPEGWVGHGQPFSADGDYNVQIDVRPNFEACGPIAGDGDDAGVYQPWVLKNDDPVISYTPVPEPLTVAGVFMAIGGIGAYIRKRTKAVA